MLNKSRVNFLLKGTTNDFIKKVYDETCENYKDRIDFDIKIVKSFGAIETLLISIAGSVGSHFIVLLIEKFLKISKKNNSEIKIEIFHEDNNVNFIIPSDRDNCIDYFKQLEGK